MRHEQRTVSCAVLGIVFALGSVVAMAGPPAPNASSSDDQKRRLHALEETLHASEEQGRRLQADVETVRADRGRLNAALIDNTARAQTADTNIAEIEKRLTTLTGSEAAIRRSLAGRCDVIARVLAALQRLGRKPPPAVLVRPDDMLQAIRTSMLLSAVVPQLRAETDQLAIDLAGLVRVRQSITTERAALRTTVATSVEEQRTLSTLMAARQRSIAEKQGALDTLRRRAAELTEQTQTLRDLVAKAERQGTEAVAAAQSAEAARNKSDAARFQLEIAAAPFKDPARLAPQIAFGDAKGMLPLPAAGAIVRHFGDADPFGGADKGLSIATRANAVVATPADGWVAFAGPYRSYGQVLIINAGSGYYVVLAGLSRISVDPQQFVLVGEPIGVMGDGAVKSAAAMAVGTPGPILYVEFRKDGAAIDPGSWWAKPEVERVRG